MMKKSILCILLVLSMCLCMILVSCKPDEEPPAPPAEVNGQVHKTPDSSSGVDLNNMPNQIIGYQTQRY